MYHLQIRSLSQIHTLNPKHRLFTLFILAVFIGLLQFGWGLSADFVSYFQELIWWLCLLCFHPAFKGGNIIFNMGH
jgi:hypothetical protein